MSFYDNLADSGYLNQQDLQNQFQSNQFLLEKSMEATNKFVDFDQYELEASNANQNPYMIGNQFKFGGNEPMTQNILPNQNYKKTFQPDLQVQTYLDQFQMPSAIKSPLSGQNNISQLDIQKNLFGQGNQYEDNDGLLKDSITGLPYNQPRRLLQIEEDDVIQIQTFNQPKEIQTGRFPKNHNSDMMFEQKQTILFNEEIEKFKNQNDQIQQVLMQLQGPQGGNQNLKHVSDPFTLNNHQLKTQINNMDLNQVNQSSNSSYHYQNLQRSQSQLIPNLNQNLGGVQTEQQRLARYNFDRLNQDNSILELAKMKDSGNSNSVTPQSLYANNEIKINRNNEVEYSRDASYIQQQQNNSKIMMANEFNKNYPQFNIDNNDFFKIPPLNTGLPTVGNSIISYQKFTPPYNLNGRLPEEYEQENIDQNLYQGNNTFLPPVRGNQQYSGHQNFNLVQKSDESMIQRDAFPEVMKQKQIPSQIHYERQISQQDYKRKEIMSKFDDIPIKDLNKADGYQEKRLDDENEDQYDDGEQNLSLIEQVDHIKWKIRMSAYKEINNQFYNEFSKNCKATKLNEFQDEEQGMNPFDMYANILPKMICDSNLVAQYEGLNCLLTYIKFAADIKQVVHQVNGILLEKIQHNKPNFREITLKIVINILKKDKQLTILPEIVRRFKNKNTKIATFACESVVECFKQQLLIDESSMKQIFKATQDNLGHSNKELRDTSFQIIQEIYKNCEDDLNNFMKNLKNLRPVQQKDIKDMLSEIGKQKSNIMLFKIQATQAQTYTEGFSPKRGKEKQLMQEEEVQQEQNDKFESDLLLLVPENFYEIPYISQINAKKKGMEAFNAELEKIISRKQYSQVQNKDYTQIFNVVTHVILFKLIKQQMLEDSNSLVFMEGIKTVEYLSQIMGKNIKAQKIRQFIGLLADKVIILFYQQFIQFKETKTGPINAVNRALNMIIKKQCLPISGFFEHSINTLTFNSKNARVKQLLLEKCDQIIQEEQSLSEEVILAIFKSVKDKVVSLIQKDTNASVRDAAISLIATFKAFSKNQEKSIIDEVINTMPKYRITEIQKLVTERQQTKVIQSPKCNSNDTEEQIQSKQKEIPQKANDFYYDGRTIPGQYQIHLADIILNIKKMATQSVNGLTAIQQKWDDAIENLGDIGLKQTKPIIISCMHWLFSQNYKFIKENQQVIDSLLNLMKKVYCIERSVEFDSSTHSSSELEQAIQIVLLSLKWINYQKQLEIILNILQSSSPTIQVFINSLLKGFNLFSSTQLRDELPQVLVFAFNWLSQKINLLLQKGLNYSDFEDIRSEVLTNYLGIILDEDKRNTVIQAIISFKEQITQQKKKIEYLHDQSSIMQEEEEKQDEEDNKITSKIVNQINSVDHYEELKLSELQQPVIHKTIGEEIAMVLDSDFNQGLQLIKKLEGNSQTLSNEDKELILQKVLSFVTNISRTPIQKQQQAFSLKALLWMKEEIFGVEDCYRFSPFIMSSFAQAEFAQRDSSVEKYLMDKWIQNFRLKDLIDRISVACSENQDLFASLFNWLMISTIKGNEEEKWAIEDFRKVSLMLAKNKLEIVVSEFFQICVEKFGTQKIQDFMEIQLMHHQQLYNVFMAWFTQNYLNHQQKQLVMQDKLNLPQTKGESSSNQSSVYNSNFVQTREGLHFQEQQQNSVDESGIHSIRGKSASSQHSQLYQKLREKRKSSNQRKFGDDDGFNKYEQIMNRLEAQLQQQNSSKKQKEPVSDSKDDSAEKQPQQQNIQFFKTNGSNYYQSDKSNRYQIVKTDEDDELEDSLHLKNDDIQLRVQQQNQVKPIQIEEYKSEKAENLVDNIILDQEYKLKESTMKENLWRLELEKLQLEKERIERERYEIMQAKNKETAEWREKYEDIRQDHNDVISNLQEANKCYLTQVSENEDLKNQLKLMQDQHKFMLKKFDEFEQRLQQQQEQQILQKLQPDRKSKDVNVVKEEQLAIVKQLFNDHQVQSVQGAEEIGVKKIQELLLNFDDKEETQRIGVALLIHYQQLKNSDQKLKLVMALQVSLENEDILFALPLETYRTLLDFNLKIFAKEKALLESTNIRASSQSMQKGINEQNQITQEAQKLVSKLLNSKEFTTSLVTLFQILRSAMPENLATDLSEEQKHYLRVVLRCISRITKALHSENPDLIRAFDVLIEMQKIFIKNPPESLREDLPCLQDFDYVYRGLKDVSDKLMELQPEKVVSFLEFIQDQKQNAFTKYMQQVMAPRMTKQNDDYYY